MNRFVWVLFLLIFLLVNYFTAKVVGRRFEAENRRLWEMVEESQLKPFPSELQQEIRRAIELEEARFLTQDDLFGEGYLSLVSGLRRLAFDNGLELGDFHVSLPEEGDYGRISLVSNASARDVLRFVAAQEGFTRGLISKRIGVRRGQGGYSLRMELQPNLLSEIDVPSEELFLQEMEFPVFSGDFASETASPDELAAGLFSRYPSAVRSASSNIARVGSSQVYHIVPGWIEFSGVEMDAAGKRIYFIVDGRSRRIRRLGIGDSDGGWSLVKGSRGVNLIIDGEEYQVMEKMQ